jgi:polyisoprenoid-binding protein YceI
MSEHKADLTAVVEGHEVFNWERSARLTLLLWIALWGVPPARAQQPDSVLYVLLPQSRFDVQTGKSGLFSFAGHDHLIRAQEVSGRIVHFPGAPERSRVEIAVPSERLEVLTPPDTEEIRKVTAAMRRDVLDVANHPEIRFVSTAVAPIPDGLRILGDLTLVGATREVTVDVRLTERADTLRAAGTFAVKQTDFGIRPYRGGPAGIVRVADRVTFSFDAVALRAGSP